LTMMCHNLRLRSSTQALIRSNGQTTQSLSLTKCSTTTFLVFWFQMASLSQAIEMEQCISSTLIQTISEKLQAPKSSPKTKTTTGTTLVNGSISMEMVASTFSLLVPTLTQMKIPVNSSGLSIPKMLMVNGRNISSLKVQMPSSHMTACQSTQEKSSYGHPSSLWKLLPSTELRSTEVSLLRMVAASLTTKTSIQLIQPSS